MPSRTRKTKLPDILSPEDFAALKPEEAYALYMQAMMVALKADPPRKLWKTVSVQASLRQSFKECKEDYTKNLRAGLDVPVLRQQAASQINACIDHYAERMGSDLSDILNSYNSTIAEYLIPQLIASSKGR